ncbi:MULTISPECIES: hypothetical protein [Dyella]|uniref:Uncharacterized protein n=2 Tax=Dyella TaxID=231454 RepID=A0A4R0Z169_9GAMM|nr:MULTISPECIES: hypothetical protein [Dyella]TBR39264.1 hypothetical protein EYV96_03290 [Dyella terrae]TCI13148.1 hypothetical protein EZM97_07575 [Dyella soli]
MSKIADSQIEKQRRRFQDATADQSSALLEASLRAATHVIQTEAGIVSEQSVRAQIKQEATTRRILDHSGHLMSSILRSALPDPWLPEAFDAAVYSISKLLCTSWLAGVKA